MGIISSEKYTRTLKSLVNRRVVAVFFLGFASGLPLALAGGTLQAWMAVEGVDLKTIGLFSLVGLPYAFKFFTSSWFSVLRVLIFLLTVELFSSTLRNSIDLILSCSFTNCKDSEFFIIYNGLLVF